MTIGQRLGFIKESLTMGWLHFFNHPLFTIRLVNRRLLYLFFRRYVGYPMTAPGGEYLYSTNTLLLYYCMRVLREHGDEWRLAVQEEAAPVVWDVGSNIGSFTRWARELNPAVIIHAIEPWPGMERYNKSADYYHACAVGAKKGKIDLILRDGEGLSASTEEGVYDGEHVSVDCETLDDLWVKTGSKQVTLLKIDVDGKEQDVLAGAKQIIAHTRIIVIEINLPKAEREKVLPQGFKWRTVNHHDFIGVRK